MRIRLKKISTRWRYVAGAASLWALSFGMVVCHAPAVSAGTVVPNFTMISVGAKTTCGVMNSLAYCWGNNANRQIGNNTTTNSLVPTPVTATGVLSGKTVTQVGVGFTHTCAIASGAAYCWGDNSFGQLGNNTTTQSAVPVAVNTSGVLSGKTVTAISAGMNFTCAVASGAGYCWGRNNHSQLGNNGGTGDSSIPVAVYTASGALSGKTIAGNANSITSGENTACAITTTGSTACWGVSSDGEIGNGTGSSGSYADIPTGPTTTGVLSGKTLITVASGGAHTCGLSSDSKIFCWGYNNWGQLGDNTFNTNRLVPIATVMTGVLSGKTLPFMDAGYENTCTIDSVGAAYCWGMGTYGELGNGTTTARALVPVAVTMTGELSGLALSSLDVGHGDTSSGAGAVCGITTNNSGSYCWGYNADGEIGNTTTTNATTPTAVLSTANLSNSGYRVYANANSSTPGTPLAATNTAATLSSTGQAFRIRTDLSHATTNTIRTNDNTFKLQFAARSAATCSAQTTGFADVTGTSLIAYSANGSVTNGSAITTNANDPTTPASTTPLTYQGAAGSFTNSAKITGNKVGLWDFSLKDNGAPANTTYCMRVVYSSGTALEAPTVYPEVKTAGAGSLDVGIVDGSGAAVTSPNYPFTTAVTQQACQTVTATFGTSTQKIRVANSLSSTGWSVSMAATGGANALWNRTDSGAKYDFNDSSGSPAGCNSGSDGDGFAGQLTVNPSSATITPQSGCSNTGISAGSSAAYVQSTTNAITLLSGSSSSALNCYWDMTGVGLSQQLPAYQAAGSYALDMTATVVQQ